MLGSSAAISAAGRPGARRGSIDLLLAFPALLLGILVAAALGSGFWSMVAVLTIAFAPRFARIARASTLTLRNEPFIEAAIAAGVSHAAHHPAAHPAQHRRPDGGAC